MVLLVFGEGIVDFVDLVVDVFLVGIGGIDGVEYFLY